MIAQLFYVKQGGGRRWAVGPIKDDNAGVVNCSEVPSMQEESPDDSYKTAAWRKKGKRSSIKPA